MKIMNVVISIHVTVFHCVSEMFSLLIFSFFLRVFLSLVSAKKCNQPFCLFIVTTIMSGSIYIIHPHLSAMCQILQFRINVFLSESATTKKKNILFVGFCFECINGTTMKLLLTVLYSTVHLNLMIFQFNKSIYNIKFKLNFCTTISIIHFSVSKVKLKNLFFRLKIHMN